MTETTTERPVTIQKPWAEMTPIEQAHHLVYDHGFGDEEYYAGEVPALTKFDSKAAVMEAWVNGGELDTQGRSYPSAEGRDGVHFGDHNGDGTEAGGDLFESGIGIPASNTDLHVHRTPLNELQFRFPLTTAVAVDHRGEGDRYTGGWVTGYIDNGLILRSDVDSSEVQVTVGVDVITLAAGPVSERWDAVSRVPFTSTPLREQNRQQQIEWFLRAITNEFADPSQRREDLRQLGALISEEYSS